MLCLYRLFFRSPNCVVARLFGHPAATTIEVRTQNWAIWICRLGSDIYAVAIAAMLIKPVAILTQVVVALVCHTARRLSRNFITAMSPSSSSRPRWRASLFEPGPAQQKWEHLTFRLLHETLTRLHRNAGAMALMTANANAAIALAGWRVLTRRMVYFCQALHSGRVVRNYFLKRSRRRLALQNAADIEEL